MSNKTAYILATGPTLAHYKPTKGVTLYGVNDICRLHQVEHLVTVDNPFLINIDQDKPEDKRANGVSSKFRDRVLATRASKPKKWYFWKTTNADGIIDYPGFVHLPLVKYNGSNLFGTYCPRHMSSPFVATELAARQGHTEIVTYGVDWIGHHTLEKKIPEMAPAWKQLAEEMKSHGITLYCGHSDSYLSTFLPVYR